MIKTHYTESQTDFIILLLSSQSRIVVVSAIPVVLCRVALQFSIVLVFYTHEKKTRKSHVGTLFIVIMQYLIFSIYIVKAMLSTLTCFH